MTAPGLTPPDEVPIAHIRERHFSIPGALTGSFCAHCVEAWPCDTARALAERDRAVRDALTEAAEAIEAVNPTVGENLATDGFYAHSYWTGWGNAQATFTRIVADLRDGAR